MGEPCTEIFLACRRAIVARTLIRRTSRADKEFHFQDWFRARLSETGLLFEQGGRNSFPDFRLVAQAEGYEVKGLTYPGREATYDANCQVPAGFHNGRVIYYVFGRYPADVDDEYPVVDLVICHGDFLNAHHDCVHKNRSLRGFGSYGDIMIRDRKMYVARTPFGLTRGTTGERTLILPAGIASDDRLEEVGRLSRFETSQLVVGYVFDLASHTLSPQPALNPTAGREHHFVALRAKGDGGQRVELKDGVPPSPVEDDGDGLADVC